MAKTVAKLEKDIFIKALKDSLTNEGFHVTEQEVKEARDSYSAIGVQKTEDDKQKCLISIDKLYSAYENHTFLEVITMVKNIFDDFLKQKIQVVDIENWDVVKDKLYIEVCNYEKHKDMLSDRVYRQVLDLAIVVRIAVSDSNVSCSMRKELLEFYPVSEDEVIYAAIENAAKLKPVDILDFPKLLAQLMGIDGKIPSPIKFVVSNTEKHYGAACMFYPGVLDKMFEEVGPFFIIPSSIHEVLIFPYEDFKKDTNPSFVKDVIAEVNGDSSVVSEEDVLSNSLYFYDGTLKTM